MRQYVLMKGIATTSYKNPMQQIKSFFYHILKSQWPWLGLIIILGHTTYAQTPVKAYQVKYSNLEKKLSLVGNINPAQTLKIQSKAAGRIENVSVEENKEVEKGTLLLSLEGNIPKLQVELSRTKLNINRNNLEDADANLNDVNRRYEEEEILYKKGSTSRAQFDNLKLQQIRSQLAKNTAMLNVLLGEADLMIREQSYEDTRILSPITGVIAKKYVEQGEVIGVGTLLFQLIDMEQVEIETSITEEELSFVQKGQSVSFSTPAYPHTVFQGEIDRVSWISDSMNRRFPVYIKATNPKQELRAGMTAQITLLQQLKNVVFVPTSAVNYEEQKPYVYVIYEGRARTKEVAVGGRFSEGTLITYGLHAGEQIVVAHEGKLENNMPILLKKN